MYNRVVTIISAETFLVPGDLFSSLLAVGEPSLRDSKTTLYEVSPQLVCTRVGIFGVENELASNCCVSSHSTAHLVL
jgi:hypothetical protein